MKESPKLKGLDAFCERSRPSMSIVALALVMASCGGAGSSGPTSPEPSTGFAADVQPIFDAHCTNCHAIGVFGYNRTGGPDENGLDLTAGRSYRSLVSQPTFQVPDEAPTLRVAPGQPDNSYLMQKLQLDNPKAGQRMPLDDPPLTPAQIERIRSWIARGAPND